MKKILNIALLILLSNATFLLGDGYRIEMKKALDTNAEDKYIPDIILPIQWNESFTSSIEYRSGEMTDSRLVDGFSDSKNDESIDHSRIKLNALNYAIKSGDDSYLFGIGAGYEKFDKTQKGYVNNGGVLNFENNIQIDILSFYLKAETIQRYSWLDMKLYAILVPISNLDVKQNTYFSGVVIDHLEASSSQSQDLSYELDADFTSKFNTFIDLSIAANYRFVPTKYKLDSGSGAIETKVDEDTLRLSARLLFNFDILQGWMPTIGYSRETVNIKDKADSSTITIEENKVYLGVNTRF